MPCVCLSVCLSIPTLNPGPAEYVVVLVACICLSLCLSVPTCIQVLQSMCHVFPQPTFSSTTSLPPSTPSRTRSSACQSSPAMPPSQTPAWKPSDSSASAANTCRRGLGWVSILLPSMSSDQKWGHGPWDEKPGPGVSCDTFRSPWLSQSRM